MTKTRQYPEQQLQITCVEWLTLLERQKRLLFTHVNNASPNAKEGHRLKKMGVRPGFPDLILFFPREKIVLIELKDGKGHLTDDQRGWYSALWDFGAPCYVCRSLAELQGIVDAMEGFHNG